MRSSHTRLSQPLPEVQGGRVPPRSFVPVVGDLFEGEARDAPDRGWPLLTSGYLAQVLTSGTLWRREHCPDLCSPACATVESTDLPRRSLEHSPAHSLHVPAHMCASAGSRQLSKGAAAPASPGPGRAGAAR